jgi:hypothetical protein
MDQSKFQFLAVEDFSSNIDEFFDTIESSELGSHLPVGTRAPLAPERVAKIWEDCKEMRVLLGKGGIAGNVFRIKPPMHIA